MNKKYLLISFFSIVTLFILIFYISPVNKTNQTDVLLNKTLYSKTFDKGQLQIFLNKTYFSNQNPKNFSSVGLTMPLPKLYDTFWGIELLKKTKESNELNNLKNTPHFLNWLNESYELSPLPNHLKMYFLTGIFKNIDYDKYQKQKFINELNLHYDSSVSLFFNKSQSESISDKLETTLNVIRIYKNMGVELKEKNQIASKCIKLLNIEINSLDPIEIFNYKGILISILLELGIDNKNDKIKDSGEWLMKPEIIELVNIENPLSLMYLKKMIELRQFYGLSLEYDTNMLYNLVKSSLFQKTSKETVEMIVEPALLNATLNLYRIKNIEFPFKEELDNYLEKAVNNNFSHSGYTEMNLQENYYGIAIAEISEYEYDKEDQKNYLNNTFVTLFEEDTTINNYEKLHNLYYLLLSLKTMNVEITFKSLIYDSLEDYLLSLDKTSPELIENLDVGVNLIDLLDLKMTLKLKQKIAYLIEEQKLSEQVYELNNLEIFSKLMNISFKANLPIQKSSLKNTLLKFKNNNGYKSSLKADAADVTSTFMAISLLDKSKQLNKEDLDDIYTFLSDDLKKDDLLGYRQKYIQTSLKSLYYSLLLSSYLN